MADRFERFYTNLESPVKDAFSITPNDGSDLTTSSRAIYIGGSGDLKVTTVANTTVTFSGTVAGSILPIRVKKVFSTGTTATNILGLL
jgi:hypothetical protein